MIRTDAGFNEEMKKNRNCRSFRRAAAIALAGSLAVSMLFTGCSKKTGDNTSDAAGNAAGSESQAGSGAAGDIGESTGDATGDNAGESGSAGADDSSLVPEIVETYEAPTYEEGANEGRNAMKVNGRDISYASVLYFAMTARDYYKQYYSMYGMNLDSSFWGALADEEKNLTFADAALDEVRLTLLQTAILDEHIAEYGAEGLDEAAVSDAQTAVDNMFSSITDEELTKAGITADSLQQLKTMYYNSYIVRQRLINDFTYEPTPEESRTLNIRLFALSVDTESAESSENGEGEDGPDLPTMDAAAELAQSALDRIMAGEDAAAVMEEIGTTISEDHLYASQYVSNPLLDAILALNAGESTIYRDEEIGSVYGIICDEVNNPETLAESVEEIRLTKAQENFTKVYEKWEEAADYTMDDEAWKEIKNFVFAD